MGYEWEPEPKQIVYAEEGSWQLLASGDLAGAQVPRVFEEAFGVAALKNPRATINKVEPLSFKPGDRIDLAVYYTPANDEVSWWQTMVVIKEGATVLVQERQHHLTMSPGQKRADCDTRRTMPETSLSLTVEVWAHEDPLTTSEPY